MLFCFRHDHNKSVAWLKLMHKENRTGGRVMGVEALTCGPGGALRGSFVCPAVTATVRRRVDIADDPLVRTGYSGLTGAGSVGFTHRCSVVGTR